MVEFTQKRGNLSFAYVKLRSPEFSDISKKKMIYSFVVLVFNLCIMCMMHVCMYVCTYVCMCDATILNSVHLTKASLNGSQTLYVDAPCCIQEVNDL